MSKIKYLKKCSSFNYIWGLKIFTDVLLVANIIHGRFFYHKVRQKEGTWARVDGVAQWLFPCSWARFKSRHLKIAQNNHSLSREEKLAVKNLARAAKDFIYSILNNPSKWLSWKKFESFFLTPNIFCSFTVFQFLPTCNILDEKFKLIL